MSSSSSPFLVPRTSSMPCTPTSYSILNPSANSFERHWPPASKRLPIRVLTSVRRNKRYWAGRVTRAAWNWTRLAVYHVLYINSSDYKLATAHLEQPHSNRVFHRGWQHNMDKMQSSFSVERPRYPLMSAVLSACL